MKGTLSKIDKRLNSKKIVTIKGINQFLYEKFSDLTKRRGKSLGIVFSNMIGHFRKKGVMTVFSLPILKTLQENQKYNIELIERMDKLEVSKQDLVSMPDKIKFHFRNIKKLIFADNISQSTFLTKVLRITNCEVEFPSHLPKLYALSKIRNYFKQQEIPAEKKDVTIRNVDIHAYNEFVAYCQLNNKLVSEEVNELLLKIIPEMEINQIIIGELQENPFDVLVISSIDKLRVTEQDLRIIEENKVIFHRVKELIFEERISNELFVSSIAGIYNCGEISLPSDISNLIAASRVRNYP